jgi:hypothetical protein
MIKFLLPMTIAVMVFITSCGDHKDDALNRNVFSNRLPSADISERNDMTIEQKEGIDFALRYYKERTERWAQDKFDLLKNGNIKHFYSDDAEFLGFRSSQNIYILSNDFYVKGTDIFQNMKISKSDGSSIQTDILRVEITNPIIGVIIDKDRKEFHEQHDVYIFIINKDGELKIQSDGDIKWYDGEKGLQLANCFVFEKDLK